MWTLLGLATVILTAPGLPQAPAPQADDVVVIDGHKDPSKIPDWAAWEDGFSTLALWAGKDNGFTHDLREALAPAEREVLDREAAGQQGRRAQAQRDEQATRAEAARVDPKDRAHMDALNVRVREATLRYRRATLDARDRVLAAISPTAQGVLQQWIDDCRSALVIRVPKSELAWWRAPE